MAFQENYRYLVFLSLISVIWTFQIENVTNGYDAKVAQFPSQVSLHFGTLGHYCGGTLVTLSDVITAAHCVSYGTLIMNTYVTVIAGDIKSTVSDKNHKTRQKLAVKNIVKHPLFNCKTLENDIAIIKLDGRFQETDYVKPLPIVTRPPEEGENCHIIGWGSISSRPPGELPESLQYSPVSIDIPHTCGFRYDKQQPFIPERMICAVAIEKRGVCKGDSGGPLVCDNKLAGIISAQIIPCFQRGGAGRFTNIAFYRNFIGDFLKWDGSGSPPHHKLMMFSTNNSAKVQLIIVLNLILSIVSHHFVS